MADAANELVTHGKPNSLRRFARRFALLAVIGLALVIGFLPTVLGSRWIYQPLIDQFAADGFRVTIDSVYLRWLSPLRLDGIQLSEQDGPPLLTIRQVSTDRSLVGYLLGGRQLGRLEIIQPTASVELLKDGTNLDRIVQAVERTRQRPQSAGQAPPAVDITVVVRGASAKVLRETGDEPLVVVPPFDIEASYQAAAGAQSSRLIIEPTQVLDTVKITKELVDLGLGHAVPLLAKSAWFDGSVSLALGKVEVPLANPKMATASMQLTLHQVRSGPNDPDIVSVLDFMARLRQQEAGSHELVFVDGSTINVVVADGRVAHEGLRFGLPRADTRLQVATSGSVGLEVRSLDLAVDVPVPVEQLAKREEVQKLGVPTIRVPVKGTLDQPRVEWASLRGDAATLLSTIRQALGTDASKTSHVVGALEGLAEGKADQAIGAAMDVIKDLRQRKKEKEASGDAPEKRPVRDALRDIFRK